jgi:hypothetical protein
MTLLEFIDILGELLAFDIDGELLLPPEEQDVITNTNIKIMLNRKAFFNITTPIF